MATCSGMSVIYRRTKYLIRCGIVVASENDART